jgi:hypothetical protein
MSGDRKPADSRHGVDQTCPRAPPAGYGADRLRLVRSRKQPSDLRGAPGHQARGSQWLTEPTIQRDEPHILFKGETAGQAMSPPQARVPATAPGAAAAEPARSPDGFAATPLDRPSRTRTRYPAARRTPTPPAANRSSVRNCGPGREPAPAGRPLSCESAPNVTPPARPRPVAAAPHRHRVKCGRRGPDLVHCGRKT